jgi:hypothetical protein
MDMRYPKTSAAQRHLPESHHFMKTTNSRNFENCRIEAGMQTIFESDKIAQVLKEIKKYIDSKA